MAQQALRLYTTSDSSEAEPGHRGTEALGDAELFRAFLLGEDAAFNTLYLRRCGQVQTYCRKMLRDAAAAMDIAQETWMRVVDMRAKPPADLANPMRLIIRIARNLCLDELKAPRRARRQSLAEVDLSFYVTEEPDALTSLEQLVLICLNRLEFDYRETIVLNLYCGYSFEEIAVMLGKSSRAIWQRASRARKKLRAMIEKEMENDRDGN